MSSCGLLSGPSVSSLIEQTLSSIMSKGDTAFAAAMSAMKQMSTIFDSSISDVGAWKPGTPGGGNTIPIQFIKPTPKPIAPSSITLPEVPVITDLGVKDLEEVLSDILNELKTLINNMPDPPTVLVGDLFLPYVASFYSQLSLQLSGVLAGTPVVVATLARLNEWLQPNAIGMSVVVEQALRDRSLADIDNALARAKQEATDERAAMGFTFPDGALDAKLARIEIDAANQRGKLNRDVLIQSAEWERDSRKFGIEKGIAYDAIMRDSFFKLYEESRSIAATWQENHIKVKLALIDIYKAEIDGFNTAANALQASSAVIIEEIKSKLDMARFKIEQFDSALKGEISRGDFDIKRFSSEISLYNQDVLSETARVETLGKTDERLLSREKITADVDIKSRELELQKVIETARVAVQALDGIARTASQISGSVYSALNMQADMSVRSSFDNNSSCSTNYNINSNG